MFRFLAERYGWTPAQIADLTMPQITAMLEDDDEYRPPVSGLAEWVAWSKANRGV